MKKEVKIGQLCGLALGVGAVSTLVSPVIAADAPEDATRWKTSAAVSAALTRGNSETLMINANVITEKKWEKNELSFGASATYGEDHDNVNASVLSAFGHYNRLFTERFYGYAHVDAYHDDVADIAYRVTLSPGVGYYLIKNDKITLSGEVGPGFVMEKLAAERQIGTNLDGSPIMERYWDEREYLTLRLSEKFTWKISDHARFWQFLDYNPKIDDWADYFLVAEAGIETDITKHLALRLVAQDTYRSEPAAGREENDFKLMAGVAYKF